MTTDEANTQSAILKMFLKFCALYACFTILTIIHRIMAWGAFLGWMNTIRPSDNLFSLSSLKDVFDTYHVVILNGLRHDLMFAFTAAIILVFLPRFIAIICALLLCAFYAVNLEHILYNLTNLDLSLLGLGIDPTFIAAQFTIQLMLYFIVFVSVILFCWLAGRQKGVKWVNLVTVLCTLPLAIAPISVIDIEQPGWLQEHPLMPNLIKKNVTVDQQAFNIKIFEQPILPVLPQTGTQKNLLIIYLEGVSQHSLQVGDMKVLQRLSAENTSYTRYFGQQLVTANGLYTTLTGQDPKHSGTDDDIYWFNVEFDDPEVMASLPNRLQDVGYHTKFIQSANINYMNKANLLPIIGFDKVMGDGSFPNWYSRNSWGVDDRALFENIITEIDNIPTGQPWMIASLTTTTHAPYNVPADFLPHEPSNRYRALQWTDQAVGHLIDDLAERGFLDNTVVVITADESRETTGGTPLEDEIGLHWLPLIILNGQVANTQTDYITSSDLPHLLISEITGTKAAWPSEEQDIMLLGNLISRRVFWYSKKQQKLLACSTHDFACSIYLNIDDLGELSDAESSGGAYFPNLQTIIESQK